jgi:Leucine-rich repeat (LRR) protein
MYLANCGSADPFQMHLNRLSVLPANFGSLQFLRTLNLSKNVLDIGTLKPITNIRTLVELYLAHNDLEGPLPSEIAQLLNLQILDLEGNNLTSVPDSMSQLGRLRVLLLGENKLKSIPWSAFRSFTSLYDLDLHSNQFCGEIIPTDLDDITLPSVSNFDLHMNSLTHLPSNLQLPALTQFNATQNNLESTGTFFASTPRLVHVYLSQNQLSVLPDGIVNLAHLRTLDIANNVIEYIDPRLGFLEELTTFMWLGNLIRMRAWGSIDTEGIKSALRAKADEASLEGIVDDLATLKVDACRGECAGTLDLTKKLDCSPLTREMIELHCHPTHFPVLSKVVMQMNKLNSAPSEISLVTTLTTLDLSKNNLSARIFTEYICLPNLLHLDISVNKVDSLDLLPTVLSAPALKVLQASFNSLTHLAPLHRHYPNLNTLYVNSNQISSITPTDLEGLEIVQLNNNNINKLPPELGLVQSLRVLGVDGNTFRVPGRRIVEAGSAALLEWLRGRCVTSEYTT